MLNEKVKEIIGWGLTILCVFFLYIYYKTENSLIFSLMMICIVIYDSWFAIYKGIIEKYEKKRSLSNPLYIGGYFRMKSSDIKNSFMPEFKNIFLSELKLMYWCDIFTIIVLILMLLCGIFSMFTETSDFVYKVSVVCWVCTALSRVFIIDYYNMVVKRKNKEQEREVNKWTPFLYNQKASDLNPIKMIYKSKDFGVMLEKVYAGCKQEGYHFYRKYNLRCNGEIWQYLKNEKKRLYIFQVIRVHELSMGHLGQMENIFESFIEDYFGTNCPQDSLYVIFLICADKRNLTFKNLFNREIIPKKGRYYLPVVFCFENDQMYITRQKQRKGIQKYKRMQKEVLSIIQESKRLLSREYRCGL